MQGRGWCFTLNNYSTKEYSQILHYFNNCKGLQYAIVAKEVGQSGTPHLQGYIEYKSSRRFSTIKKRLPRSHLEKRKGSPHQASAY